MVAKEYYQKASDVRKNWSMTIDSVVHDKPAFINRTRDRIMMMDYHLLLDILSTYKYHIIIEEEDDGSKTGFVDDLGLVENADTEDELLRKLVSSMKDYAEDYYNQFNYWSKAPNRVSHVPYVIKLLISDDNQILEDMICQSGKN